MARSAPPSPTMASRGALHAVPSVARQTVTDAPQGACSGSDTIRGIAEHGAEARVPEGSSAIHADGSSEGDVRVPPDARHPCSRCRLGTTAASLGGASGPVALLRGGQGQPGTAPDVFCGGLQPLLLLLPGCRGRQFQVIPNAQDHDWASEAELLEEPIRDANAAGVVQGHPGRLREHHSLEIVHRGVTDQRPAEVLGEVREGPLRPEPEVPVGAGRRDEGIAVDLRVDDLAQL